MYLLFLTDKMKWVVGFFVFCIILFMYIHVNFHLKTSEDLEMYEVEDASKDKLEEICDIRQPVMFRYNNSKIEDYVNKKNITDNYSAFDLKIRNTSETDNSVEMFNLFPLYLALKLFDEDTDSMYYTENNQDFLKETGLIKHMRGNDEYLRPYMVSSCNYDIVMGSLDCVTPFRYELNYRTFIMVTQGTIHIKLSPPASIKYLDPVYDYDNYEFKTLINPWNVQQKYVKSFNKIKCLEFSVEPGKMLFLPSYWWYSIKFGKDATLVLFKYKTYMNQIATLPYSFMHALQLQNVKRDFVKKSESVDTETVEQSKVDETETVLEEDL